MGGPAAAPAIGGFGSVVLPACEMILYVIGDLLADGRQFKHLVLYDRIVGLLGKSPIHGRLVPEIVRPIHAGHNTDEPGVETTLCGYCS
jgi:hypothetical protein